MGEAPRPKKTGEAPRPKKTGASFLFFDCLVCVHKMHGGCTGGQASTGGPSGLDSAEDGGSLADAVRRQSCEGACDHADAPGPHDALKERISEHFHEQTVDQAGDQACRDTADSIYRQGCRYACGDATTGPSYSDGVVDHRSPAGAVRRQSYGGADGMRQVAAKMWLPRHVRRGRRM